MDGPSPTVLISRGNFRGSERGRVLVWGGNKVLRLCLLTMGKSLHLSDIKVSRL